MLNGNMGEKVPGNLTKIHNDLEKLWSIVSEQPNISKGNKAAIKSLYSELVRSVADSGTSQSQVLFNMPGREDMMRFIYREGQTLVQWH